MKNLARKAYANALVQLAFLNLAEQRPEEQKLDDSLHNLERFGTSYDRIRDEMFRNMNVAEQGKDFVNRIGRIKRNQEIRSYACIDTIFELGKHKIAYQAPVQDIEILHKRYFDYLLNKQSPAGVA